VRARGPYVVAVNEGLDEADIYRLEDGRYLGKCEFKQDASRRVNLLVFDDVICGPATDDQVVAMDLATPGVERWRVRTDASVSQLFKPSADLLAVSDRRGGVQLIEPDTGNMRMALARVTACEDGITDGSLSGGVLYVCGYKKRRTSDEPQRWGLAAVRIQDRSVLWSRDDLGQVACLNQDVLECAANAIPVASLAAEDGNRGWNGNGPRNSSTGKLSLLLLDKAAGNPIGQRLEVPLDTEAGASRALSVAVYPGQVQVTAGAARLRFPCDPASAPHADGPSTQPVGESETPAGVDAGKYSEAGRP
jgi:hypothetical protein